MIYSYPFRWMACVAIIILMPGRGLEISRCFAKPAPAPVMRYLDNGKLRVGVNLAMGGAITSISRSGKKTNLINHCDLGREIQMSDYSGPNPYIPPGKIIAPAWRGLGWNPIQCGDAFGFRSKITYFHQTASRLVVRCIPMIWPLKNVPAHCTFQCTIRLHNNAIYVRCATILHRMDHTQYPGRPQECPAIYTVGKYWRLVSYTGNRPFTHRPLTFLDTRQALAREQAVFAGKLRGDPWIPFHATENWAAMLNSNDNGIGVWSPGTFDFSGGFFGAQTGHGGPASAQTGYMAPNQSVILDHNIIYQYHYVLIVGNLKDIRDFVYRHAKRPRPPVWTFTRDRQGWVYHDAIDTGWPVKGRLNISLAGHHPELVGPSAFWPARQAPVLYMDAAFKTSRKSGRMFWRNTRQTGFAAERSIAFKIIGDGHYHHYAIRLSASTAYRGHIAQIMIAPVKAGEPGAWLRLRSIGFSPAEPRAGGK